MNDIKIAKPDHPVHEIIAKRWSPYVFDDRPVSREDLLSIFEAARWAPSCFNEQPWRYIVVTKEDPQEYERLLSCINESNREWAKNAPVLALGLASRHFEKTGKVNPVARHDLGQASSYLTFEATSRGLYVHQMLGILPDRAVELYEVPEEYRVLTGIAIGYVGKADEGEFAERDKEPRPRNPLSEFLFGGRFGESYR
jgi:nitroreductase